MKTLVSRCIALVSPLHTPQIKFMPMAVLGLSLVLGLSWAHNSHGSPSPLGNDEAEFVFSGQCPNGEKYRLFAYTQILGGQAASFYDYEGPTGKGTIRSNTTPRTLAVRVCRKLAEIIDDH